MRFGLGERRSSLPRGGRSSPDPDYEASELAQMAKGLSASYQRILRQARQASESPRAAGSNEAADSVPPWLRRVDALKENIHNLSEPGIDSQEETENNSDTASDDESSESDSLGSEQEGGRISRFIRRPRLSRNGRTERQLLAWATAGADAADQTDLTTMLERSSRPVRSVVDLQRVNVHLICFSLAPRSRFAARGWLHAFT